MARRNYARRSGCVWAALASLFLAVITTPVAFSADPAVDVAARLAAGEFGPAIDAANTAKDPAVRDNLLANIAVKQGKIGARRAALETAGDISNDLARQASLASMSASGSAANQAGKGTGSGARGGAAM